MKNKKILYFYADWCAPCRAQNIILNDFEENVLLNDPSITLEKINIDEDIETTKKYDVSAIPTFIFINEEDNIYNQQSRVLHIEDLKSKIELS